MAEATQPPQDWGNTLASRALATHGWVMSKDVRPFANPLLSGLGADLAVTVMAHALAPYSRVVPLLIGFDDEGGLRRLRTRFADHEHPQYGIGTLVVGMRLSDDGLTTSAYVEFIPFSLEPDESELKYDGCDPTRVDTANPRGVVMHYADCLYPPTSHQSNVAPIRARIAGSLLATRLAEHYGLEPLY